MRLQEVRMNMVRRSLKRLVRQVMILSRISSVHGCFSFFKAATGPGFAAPVFESAVFFEAADVEGEGATGTA